MPVKVGQRLVSLSMSQDLSLGAVYGGVGHCMDVNFSSSARTQHISEQNPDSSSISTKSRLHLHSGALSAKKLIVRIIDF